MKTAVLTGGAGFAGFSLAEELIRKGYRLLCMVRPGSPHNERLLGLEGVSLIELDMFEVRRLTEFIHEPCDVFFHLAWVGGRDDFNAQYRNIDASIWAVEAAAALGCKRILITGSQAEYGYRDSLTTEEALPCPFSAYGAAKAAAMHLTKRRSQILGIEWIWGRIFSLYGKYEPEKTLLSYIIKSLREGVSPGVTSCEQYWDYLDSSDAAKAIIALMEKGITGEIYNIANGDFKRLRCFTEELRLRIAPEIPISYGAIENPRPVSLMPSVEKLQRDTGWRPEVSFPDGYPYLPGLPH